MLDFDDLITKSTRLLDENEEVRSRWQQKIRYLLVDEYQDTNTSQYQLVKLLVGKRGRFTVIGDDDQSILNVLQDASTYPAEDTNSKPLSRSCRAS